MAIKTLLEKNNATNNVSSYNYHIFDKLNIDILSYQTKRTENLENLERLMEKKLAMTNYQFELHDISAVLCLGASLNRSILVPHHSIPVVPHPSPDAELGFSKMEIGDCESMKIG